MQDKATLGGERRSQWLLVLRALPGAKVGVDTSHEIWLLLRWAQMLTPDAQQCSHRGLYQTATADWGGGHVRGLNRQAGARVVARAEVSGQWPGLWCPEVLLSRTTALVAHGSPQVGKEKGLEQAQSTTAARTSQQEQWATA